MFSKTDTINSKPFQRMKTNVKYIYKELKIKDTINFTWFGHEDLHLWEDV